ncbi:16S rRNA processing protein RimM [Sphaerochaeta pleomorpha str. Grapes]|uniref:Ribosome maturation factor RimM n=1 Tax=Sphaerochaeta pleomorpha (strain ATCC BAA-1885 / DSM 22778 / Grapes) TaxID=158190 RepID=G8QWQ8_SPHPG|nr:ribosome maturation factor RimM [Sphaerochaeta pleomorpha]AEV28352.1 16S rRNA processing protein RimM [Sphaerochaeta pleomorpha str. Grapes]
MEQMLCTAIVQSPFGIHGEVKIYSYNDDFRYLGTLKEVVLRCKDGTERIVTIEKFRMQGSQALMKFSGYDTPEDARALAGCSLMVERGKATPLKKGQHYVSDLIGCSLVHDGEVLATVVNAFDGAQAVLLEVSVSEGKTCMVPYLEQYIGTVDTKALTIELKTPWILE